MSSIENKNSIRKTKTLAVSGLDQNTTIIAVANGCENFISWVKGIRLVKHQADDSRKALIDFITSQQCEDAKLMGDIIISGQRYPLRYARSREQQQHFQISASENKLYVRYPEGANESEIVRMLGDVSISKPERARNFFFATCKDIDQQCSLVKALNNKALGDGELVVKVAIDRMRKPRTSVVRRS